MNSLLNTVTKTTENQPNRLYDVIGKKNEYCDSCPMEGLMRKIIKKIILI